MPWAPQSGAGRFLEDLLPPPGVLGQAWLIVGHLLWLSCPQGGVGMHQLPCHGAAAELGPIRTVVSADPTVPLQPRAERRVFRGWRSLWWGRRGCGAGCGLAAGLGWEGKRPGAGSDALHTRRKREQHCPPRDSCRWLGTVRLRRRNGKSCSFPWG